MGVTESHREPEREPVRARVEVTESHREQKRASESQREPDRASESLREQVRARGSQSGSHTSHSELSIWKACYKKEASLTFLAYLTIVLLQNN